MFAASKHLCAAHAKCDGIVLSIIINCNYILIFYACETKCASHQRVYRLIIVVLYAWLLLFHVIFIRLSNVCGRWPHSTSRLRMSNSICPFTFTYAAHSPSPFSCRAFFMLNIFCHRSAPTDCCLSSLAGVYRWINIICWYEYFSCGDLLVLVAATPIAAHIETYIFAFIAQSTHFLFIGLPVFGFFSMHIERCRCTRLHANSHIKRNMCKPISSSIESKAFVNCLHSLCAVSLIFHLAYEFK